MRSFQSRNFGRRLIYSRVSIAAMLAVAVFAGQATLRSFLESRNARKAYVEVNQKHEELISQKDDLEKRLEYLASDYGLERELRRKFGLVKPDEEILVIVDRPQSAIEEGAGNMSSMFSALRNFLAGFFKF